ncbi:hypothetical protein ACHAWF_009704 [Thalassiosira exigua]
MKVLLFAVWSLTSSIPATSAVTIRGGSAIDGFTSKNDDGELDYTNSSRFLMGDHRRLLAHEGVMRTLILRVTDGAGNAPITDARRESDTWFGTHGLLFAENQNSLFSLYDQCSGGKLVFVPATGPGVVDGVLEFPMDQDMSGQHISTAGGTVRDKFNALNGELGIEFEAYSIILPVGVSGSGGLAHQRGAHQYYAGGSDRSLQMLMHEFGHNLGWQHSGLALTEADNDDDHCMMSCCAGTDQMCFNAAKSWFSGWYNEEGKQGYVDAEFDTPGQWWKETLVGIDDYLKNVYDETQHRVVLKLSSSLYAMFNRKKGVNSGVMAYGNEVVIIQQWGEGGKSRVLAHLNEDNRVVTFQKDSLYTDFDVVLELCEISYAPIVTGPQIIGGTATQSSTAAGAEASRAIDGNLDQTWAGGSVTHTTGDDEDLDPWWKVTYNQSQEVEHVRILNRNDCCGSRLSNAILELHDEGGVVVYSRSLGSAEPVKDVFLGSAYRVKEIVIKPCAKYHMNARSHLFVARSKLRPQLFGNKVLSLAEVQAFGPSGQNERSPDFARVVAYASDGLQSIGCDTTLSPTTSILPSASPTLTLQPTIYRAVPRDVILLRDDSPCVLQSNPEVHPDRIKCMLQSTVSNSEPGGYGNDETALRGKNGCLVVVQPVTWSWQGTAFVFQTSESLNTINECFGPGVLIAESMPTSSPSVAPSPSAAMPSQYPTKTVSVAPSETPSASSTRPSAAPSAEVVPNAILLRDNSLCIFQSNPSNHPDRFKVRCLTFNIMPPPPPSILTLALYSIQQCLIEPTTVNSKPGGYGNKPIALRGVEGCLVIVRPVTWAWDGTAFIFESSKSLDSINECFAPGVLLSKSEPTSFPSIAPSSEVVPNDVILLRDDGLCIFQSNPSNHPDRFKCPIQPTTPNATPGGYGNDPTALRGSEGCLIIVRPVTWAWDGTAFIFESSESLGSINDCFAPGALLTEGAPTSVPSIAPSAPIIPPGVTLQRDGTPCVFQVNPANHPDRYKCTILPTSPSALPGGYGNDLAGLRGSGGCVLYVRPVTWAWDGTAFVFESSDNLDAINACFGADALIAASHDETDQAAFFW